MSPRPRSSEIHRVTQSEPRKGMSFSRQFRFWVWINIVLQFFLPLMLAFTPAVRAAQIKWYQTPPEQQMVTVSSSELPTLGGNPASDEKSEDGNDKATETRTAQLASKTGQFLNNASGDAAVGIARQMATGKASAEIEQWLNRVGTARVQMQLDEEFSLKNSSVDLLIPWYDSPDTLLFSQHSLHRTDDRTQGNLGAGYRYYTPDWMAGVNAFYDYDFSGEHSRMGMGLEYGRDYLKLAANGYFRLSGWKNASDLADYEARPANGWDIRSEGYLPVYPQLGGKLVYEQYYGKEVGLFGRDNRQQDPRAITAGLSYTPFPLMTLSADHRMGEGGENDTRLGVEFSWQFDTPLHKLLDTDAVGQMRTLAGSRYHLVDRNNNIVLEYREKNNLTLKMADALRGYQGDRLSLDVVVNARHGLERIVWDDSALRAAGGEVTCTANTQCVVTLPLWKTGGIDANTYVISAVAHDKAGNHSPQASTYIFVEQSAVNAENSTFEIVPTDDPNAHPVIIEADGVTTATMTFRALDGQGLPVSSLNPEILQHESSLGGLTISSVREVSAGVYVATVSGNTAGEAWMAPVVNGSALSSLRKPVTFVTSAFSIDFSVVTDNAIADGVLPNSVKATLTDEEGSPLVGKVVNFSVDNGATIAASGTTGADGSVIMTLTSTVAGAATVTASINGNSESVNVTFTADAGSAHIAEGALERVINDALANGSATNSVKATVTDANRNPLSGQVVNFSADNGATIAASGTTGVDGTVTMTLTSTVAGEATVTASINNSSRSVSVTFTADTTTAQIADGALERVINGALADGTATNSVKATVTDANRNPLSGQVVNFSADNGATIAASGTTGADGTVTMTLTSTVAGDSTVTASINNSSESVDVTFVADTGTAQIADGALERVINDALANGSATNSVKATVTDANGNLLSGQTVNFSVNNGATIVASGTTGDDGTVTMTLTSTVAGEATVTASINNSSRSVSVTFTADTSTARIADGALERVINDALANGSATNSVKATVTDANGNILIGQTVNFSADNGATIMASGTTGNDGTVTMTLTSMVVGDSTVTASINNSSESVEVTFVADIGTAQIAAGALEIVGTGARADGVTTNSVKATVTDARGTPLPGQLVNFSADNGATIAASGTTNGAGTITMSLTSLVAGDVTVTASINGSSQSVSVTFVADENSAQMSVTVDSADAVPANGSATRTVTATLIDENRNPLRNQAVSFTVSDGPVFSGEASGTTGNDGTVTVTLTSTVAGTFTVSAAAASLSLNGSAEVAFIADASSAQLVIETSSDATIANGTDRHPVMLKVEDAQGNALTSVHNVTLEVPADGPLFSNNAATLSTSTDSNGELEVPLTSTVAGTFTVSASLGSDTPVSVQVRFAADASTARLVIETSSDATTANGTDSHPVTLKVKDAQGNALAGVRAVRLDVPTAGPLFSNDGVSLSANTDSNGELEVPLTSMVAGTFTVSARLGSGAAVSTQVTFAADLSTARLIIETSADTKTATGADPHPVTLKVVDAQNNALAGVHAVTLSVPADGPLFSNNAATLSTSTDSNGELEVPLTSTVVGTFTVNASLGSDTPVSADVTFVRYEIYTATISLSPETDGTDLSSDVSITANGTDQTRVVVVIKDQDQRPAVGLTGLKIKANQSLMKEISGGEMTAGTEYDLVPSTTDGVYYKTVVAGTDTGSVRFNVTSGLTENDIAITSNSVTVNLTAGEPASAGVYLSSETDGTDIASRTTTLAANGTDQTNIVIVVKDANGHGVTGLENGLKVKTSTGGLLSTTAGTEIAGGTEYGVEPGTADGVYYLTLKAGTTLGTVVFNVTDGLPDSLIPVGSNNVTINLTAGEQSVAGVYLSSETDGTALERTKSLVADGNSRSYTRVVVTVKDANGHGINGLTPQITALSGGGLLKNANGVSMTEGTAFSMVPGTADGVYYLSVWAKTTSGTVKFSVTGGLNSGVIPAGQNNVTVNLTAGAPSVAGIYLSSETDGTALASTKSLVANGSSYTRVVVTVKDANGNGVNDLPLKIAAQSGGGLLRNASNVSMAEGANFDMVRGTADGVYYLSVWAGTTSGTVTFSVTDGLDDGVIPSGSNTVTVNLTAGAPSVAGIYLSSEADGTALESTKSLVAIANSNYTRVVVTVKDANGNGVNGLPLKIAAQSGGGLLTSGGVSMTQGTDFDMIAAAVDGVYYLNVWSGNTSGTVKFSVTGGLNSGVIPTGSNNVTVNLTAGDPSVAGIYLSSETDGTALASTKSLVANGSSYTRVVVTVKDANGNGVNGLPLKIAAQSGGGLLRNASGAAMAQGTEYAMAAGAADGVYYLSVWSRTTTGTVKFSVTGGLDSGLIPTGSNNVTIELTPGAQSVAGIYLSSAADGTTLTRTKSLVADGSNYTRVVVTVKDANGNGINGLPLTIAAQSGSGLMTSGGTSMTQGTNFTMIPGTGNGVYYLNVWAGTKTGTVTFSVTGGLNSGVIPTGSNNVTVNLTAGSPSVAGVYLSSETNGTALTRTKSLEAVVNGNNYTRVVVTVKDANGNGVKGLNLKVAAQSGGGLLRNASGAAIPQGTEYTMSSGTVDGVYYLSVWAGTKAGTVTFSVTGGLNSGVIPTGSNNVTVTLTVPPPASAQINAWWSYQGGSNSGSTYRTFGSAVRFLNSSGTPMQCDSVTIVGTSGVGYRAEASSVRDLYSYSADKWNNGTSDNEGSNSFNSSTKVYTFTKYSYIGVTGKQGVTYNGVLTASGSTTYPLSGQGYLGGDDRLTFSCKVGNTTYSFKSSNGMTVNSGLGI